MHTGANAKMVIPSLFIIAKTCMQPACTSMLHYVAQIYHTLEYSAAVEMSKVEPDLTNMEKLIYIERKCKLLKDKNAIIPFIYTDMDTHTKQ